MIIRCIPVVSSNLEAIGYDRPTSVLRVIFQGGRAYDYADVPLDVVVDLMFTESHGGFFAKKIKGIYAYQKVEEE